MTQILPPPFVSMGGAIHKRPTSEIWMVCTIMGRTQVCLVSCPSVTAILPPAHSYTSEPFTNGSGGDEGEKNRKDMPVVLCFVLIFVLNTVSELASVILNLCYTGCNTL